MNNMPGKFRKLIERADLKNSGHSGSGMFMKKYDAFVCYLFNPVDLIALIYTYFFLSIISQLFSVCFGGQYWAANPHLVLVLK